MRPKLPMLKCQHGPCNTYLLSCPIGDMELQCCTNGIHSFTHIKEIIPDYSIPVAIISQLYGDNGYTHKAATLSVEWLQKYFNGHLADPQDEIPPICYFEQLKWNIKCPGNFHLRVWKALKDRIKFGHTCSYKRLAVLINSPYAVRAVGNAMRNNPVILFIPCHRVISNSGDIGNYYGGSKNYLKEWLLKHEYERWQH